MGSAPPAGPAAHSDTKADLVVLPVPSPARYPSDRRRLSPRVWLLPLLGLAAIGAGAGWLADHWGVEETDNAQLRAPLTTISSRIPGTIARVLVEDNQGVSTGQPLVLLDDRDARAHFYRAAADLREAQYQASASGGQAGTSASGATAAANVAIADRLAAEAEARRSGAVLNRLEFLLRQGGVSQQDVERARADFQKAQSQLVRSEATRNEAMASRNEVGVDRQKFAAAEARILQAQAALAEAQLQASYVRIVAPSTGRIGSRMAEPGRQVQPGQPLMTLVGPHPWVEANFKETQLAAIRPGQPAEVRLDSFPGRRFRGTVESIAPASGASFAVLPPENATGNFTKVVQRVPVRIRLDPRDTTGIPLVPGLSASVRIRRP